MAVYQQKLGDTSVLIDELAMLVFEGKKTATCGRYIPHAPLEQVGDFIDIQNASEKIVCRVQVTEVEIVRFCDVSADFAEAEGEGDGSLIYWRIAHQEFFTREGVFAEDMPLVCLRFRKV